MTEIEISFPIKIRTICCDMCGLETQIDLKDRTGQVNWRDGVIVARRFNYKETGMCEMHSLVMEGSYDTPNKDGSRIEFNLCGKCYGHVWDMLAAKLGGYKSESY